MLPLGLDETAGWLPGCDNRDRSSEATEFCFVGRRHRVVAGYQDAVRIKIVKGLEQRRIFRALELELSHGLCGASPTRQFCRDPLVEVLIDD